MAYKRGRRAAKRAMKRAMKRPRYAIRRGVPGLLHRVKRLGNTVFIKNSPVPGTTNWVPTLVQNGGNGVDASFIQGAITAGALSGTWDFTLSSQYFLDCLQQRSDMTNFFDRYKIVGIKLSIHYLQNATVLQNVANVAPVYSNLPTLYYAFDADDALVNTAPQIQQKGYCKSRVLNANKPISVYIRPRITKEVAGLTAPGVTSERPCWVDCNAATIPHFGMKFVITDWVGGEINNALRIVPTYYVQFKDTN